MNDLDRHVEGAARAHQALLADADELAGDAFGRPSLLPGWTVGHVLGHLTGNADSHVRMIAGAVRGEVVDQYPGGPEGRAAEIDALAALPPAEVVDRLRRSIWQLEQAWATCTADGWAGTGNTAVGPTAIADLPFRRWRETVVHHADLGGTYNWRAWPADYVRRELAVLTMLWASRRPMGLTSLPDRALEVPDAQRVAWLLGRAEIDGLEPAGVFR